MEKLYGALYKGQPIPLEVAMGYLHRHPELSPSTSTSSTATSIRSWLHAAPPNSCT